MSGVEDPGFAKALSYHGYGFQYAVLKRCLDVRSGWRHAVSEYPVELQGSTTHVDFALAWRSHYIVAECKRVYGWRWGFARGLKASRSSWADASRADYIVREEERRRRVVVWFGTARPYDVAIELNAEGAREAKQFHGAVSQVLRASGGFIEDLCAREPYVGGVVVPVIFTTAPLVATDTELATADLATGNLEAVESHSVPWLWYDENVAAPLRPSVPRVDLQNNDPRRRGISDTVGSLQATLDRDATRSIAIVSVDGIEDFLQTLPMLLDASEVLS